VSEQIIQEAPSTAEHAANQFRSQVGHISRQSGIFLGGTLFTALFSYVFKVYLAHVLGAEELGLYALGMTLIGFIGIFNTLGLPQSAVRFVAQYKASGQFRELHGLLWRGAGWLILANVFFAGILLTFGRWVALRFYHSAALVKYLPLFALIMLAGVVTNFYGKVLAGYRDLKLRTLIVNFIGSPLNMVIAVVLISIGMGLRGYLAAQILSAIIVCILLLAAVHHFTPASARFWQHSSAAPRREVWSFSVAMLGVGVLEFVISQVDKIALGFYSGARQVGVYSIAAALVAYVPLFLGSVNQIFAPTIADLYARGEHVLLARLFQSLTKWVIGLTIPGALVAIVFAHPLMSIFGRDFESGWPILIIGTAGQLINCAVGSVGYLLLMSGNEKELIKAQSVMALVMVICCVILVPLSGMEGAAIAAALVNVGINLWNLVNVKRTLGIWPYNQSYLHLLAPMVVTSFVVLSLRKYASGLHHNWLSVALALAVAYSSFPAVFYLTSGLDDDDRMIARALRSRIRGVFTVFGAQG
jgi:O-antigen/teichoic acid export membrane protein